jgi:small subunit ribosomal protein S20
MANHKSALKKIRSDKKKHLLNKAQLRDCKKFIKELKKQTNKDAAQQMLSVAVSKLDKLANKNILHKNNSGRKKSSLYEFVKKLA